jgi:hypothetical protein
VGVQHKVFRVERMVGGRAAMRMASTAEPAVNGHKAAPPEQSAPAESALQREVGLLREICARNKRELSALI